MRSGDSFITWKREDPAFDSEVEAAASRGVLMDDVSRKAVKSGEQKSLHAMDVYDAVTSRRAVRGFTNQPVPREALERVLSAARWSPSGSNIQPWHTYVLTGAPLAKLKKLAVERVAAGDPWDEREYEMYPPALKSPYSERRSAFGKERYSALGIEREDWEARQRAAIANWNCFGAPAALFCYIDRDLGRPQWADLGMYLQTVMLLLRAEGLHSCLQMAWSVYRKTVAEVVSP